jgi:hypothetical protein
VARRRSGERVGQQRRGRHVERQPGVRRKVDGADEETVDRGQLELRPDAGTGGTGEREVRTRAVVEPRQPLVPHHTPVVELHDRLVDRPDPPSVDEPLDPRSGVRGRALPSDAVGGHGRDLRRQVAQGRQGPFGAAVDRGLRDRGEHPGEAQRDVQARAALDGGDRQGLVSGVDRGAQPELGEVDALLQDVEQLTLEAGERQARVGLGDAAGEPGTVGQLPVELGQPERPVAELAGDASQQLLERHGLDQVVVGSCVESGELAVDPAVAGHEQDPQRLPVGVGPDGGDEVDAGPAGHVEVDEGQVDGVTVQDVQRRGGARRLVGAVAAVLERGAEDAPDGRVVVDDQDRGVRRVTGAPQRSCARHPDRSARSDHPPGDSGPRPRPRAL